MDKDVRDKYYRVVGQFEALETAVKSCSCMPGDTASNALLDATRILIHRLVTSAWQYAEERTGSSARGESDAS